jgi:hypothetical protein
VPDRIEAFAIRTVDSLAKDHRKSAAESKRVRPSRDDHDKQQSEGHDPVRVFDNEDKARANELLRAYGQRAGLNDEEVADMVDAKQVINERGRLGKPGHYFKGEIKLAFAALREERAAAYLTYKGVSWTDERTGLVRNAARGDDEVEQKRRIDSYFRRLSKILDQGNGLIEELELRAGVLWDSSCKLWDMRDDIRELRARLEEPLRFQGSPLPERLVVGDTIATTDRRRFVWRALTDRDQLWSKLGCQHASPQELADMWILAGGTVDIQERSWESHPDGLTVAELREKFRDAITECVREIEQRLDVEEGFFTKREPPPDC